MKKYLLLLTALFFSSLVVGQDLPAQHGLTWSKPIANQKKATYSQFIGETEEGVLVTKTTLKKELRGNQAFPLLEVYDKNFSLIKSQNLDVKEGKGKIIYENTVLINGNLHLFYSLVHIWSQSITLMDQPLDINTLEATGEPKQVLVTKIPALTTRDQLTSFQFNFSPDNSSLLISNIEPVGGNKNPKIHLYALDGPTGLAWNKEVELPYQARQFDIVSRSVDNQGNVYLLGSKYREGTREKKNGRPNYDYVLLGYTEGGSPSFSHNIISKDKFFREMAVTVTPKSEIICTGYYSNHDIGFAWNGSRPSKFTSTSSFKKTDPVAGVYYLKIDLRSKAVLKEKYNEFTLDFLTQNLDKKVAKKAMKITRKAQNSESFSFGLDNLILREDGSVTLVGEQVSNTTHNQVQAVRTPGNPTENPFNATSTSKHFGYGDIIALHLSPDGDLEWSEKIAKKQKTVADFGVFSSYAMAFENNRLHFVFNENRKNLLYNGKGTLSNFNPRKGTKNAALAIVTLDAQGNKSKKHVVQPAGSTVFIKSSTTRQFSEDCLFLFGQYKKDFRLAKIEFQ